MFPVSPQSAQSHHIIYLLAYYDHCKFNKKMNIPKLTALLGEAIWSAESSAKRLGGWGFSWTAGGLLPPKPTLWSCIFSQQFSFPPYCFGSGQNTTTQNSININQNNF